MSRWSRRSQEERERIASEQQALVEQGKKPAWEKDGKKSDEHALEIYKKSRIPILCPKCFDWVAPPRLEVCVITSPLPKDGELKAVKGVCPNCGTTVRRVFPLGLGSDAVVFFLVFKVMKDQGLITGQM